MKDYKKLIVWQKAHKLVLSLYKVSRDFPSEEKFNLISQIRRAATSVPTNISEVAENSLKETLLNIYKMPLAQHRKSNT